MDSMTVYVDDDPTVYPERLPVIVTPQQDQLVRDLLAAYFNHGSDAVAFKVAMEQLAMLHGVV